MYPDSSLVVVIKTESNYFLLGHPSLTGSIVAEDMGSGGRPRGSETQLCHCLITLSKLLTLSVPQFPHYKRGMINMLTS